MRTILQILILGSTLAMPAVAQTWGQIRPATVDVISTTYDFAAQVPGGSLTAATPATVILRPCPKGVAGADVNHYLYISNGTGTAEAVLVTGGTCTSGAASGTVLFTPANNHTGAWTIRSASGGIFEAQKVMGGKGILTLPVGTTYIRAKLILPTTLSLHGQGASTSFAAPVSINTLLRCDPAATPCIALVDNLGTANGQGMGIHKDYWLYGSGSGSGLWIGGDPAGVWAGVTWTGSYISTDHIVVSNFTNALTLYAGNFINFHDSRFNGISRALLIPANATSDLQPVGFYGCLLDVSAGIAVQQDWNGYMTCPMVFVGGQVSGTLTGLQMNWESYGTHYETNDFNTRLLTIAANGTHKILIVGGLMSVHGSGSTLTSICDINGSGYVHLTLKDIYVQADVGMTIANYVNVGTVLGTRLHIENIFIAPGGIISNLYSVTTDLAILGLTVVQPKGLYYMQFTAATATAFPKGNYPLSEVITFNGATVGGGITSVTDLQKGQMGVFHTDNPQTFTAGATIGATVTTVANTPYTYYFDGTKIWIK